MALMRKSVTRSNVLMLMTLMLIQTLMLTAEGATVRHARESNQRHKRSEGAKAEWSVWFNSDRPWTGQGDFETTDSISKTERICSWEREVVSAECRVAGSNDTFDSTSTTFLRDHLLQACSSHGLICLNSHQSTGLCRDYQVRFLCQDLSTDDEGSSLFPNLDYKIYILLAAVPLLIVTLRILWSCFCKPRLKRRRQEQNRRRQQRDSDDSDTISNSSSQGSIDPALASPPPAYHDLFGEVGSGSRPVIFSISGGECHRCGKCLHFTEVGRLSLRSAAGGRGVVVSGGGDSLLNDDVFLSPSSSSERDALENASPALILTSDVNVTTQNNASSDTTTSAVLTSQDNSSSAPTSNNDANVTSQNNASSPSILTSDVLITPQNNTSLTPTSTNEVSATSQNIRTSENSASPTTTSQTDNNTTSPNNTPTTTTTNMNTPQPILTSPLTPSLPSNTSLLGAASPPLPSQLRVHQEDSLPPGPCTCPCHKGQTGQVNLAFQLESSDLVEAPRETLSPDPRYPGMHKPVLSFSRIGSVTSFSSYVSVTELPDYEEALEILRKGGFVLGEECEDKVANL